MSKVSVAAAASKLVGKSQYEPPTITLKEERNEIFANINTSSSETNEDDTTKVVSKKKSKYDLP